MYDCCFVDTKMFAVRNERLLMSRFAMILGNFECEGEHRSDKETSFCEL